jgi:hypothetical protein
MEGIYFQCNSKNRICVVFAQFRFKLFPPSFKRYKTAFITQRSREGLSLYIFRASEVMKETKIQRFY